MGPSVLKSENKLSYPIYLKTKTCVEVILFGNNYDVG